MFRWLRNYIKNWHVKCYYCHTSLRQREDGVWVDNTEGDVCWGNYNLTNENRPHEPMHIHNRRKS